MQLVFLNTFEKVSQDGLVLEATLSIGQQDGGWSVTWQILTPSGDEEQSQADLTEIWFEGSSWEELLAGFRHGVAVKMGEGFAPLLDGMLDERRSLFGTGNAQSLLQCYGEMHANAELFEALREWRRMRASADKKSAFMVATNRLLWMISAYVPHTLEELAQLPGWGETKQSSYGHDVLHLTAGYTQQRSFPLDWVEHEVEPSVFAQWLFRQKENKYKSQINRHQQKRQLLGAIAEGKSLEQLQSELELSRRELMERIERLDSEGYDVEPLIARELEHMPSSEQQLVWDALESVGDKYLKPVLQTVYGEESVNGKSLDKLYDRLRLIRLRYRRERPSAV